MFIKMGGWKDFLKEKTHPDEIEDDVVGVVNGIEVDGNKSSELVGIEVRFEAYAIAFWDNTFWESRLAFELYHISKIWKHIVSHTLNQKGLRNQGLEKNGF